MPLGLYISVPFCRTKCSYCNFASDVFSRSAFESYIARVCAEIEHSPENTGQAGATLDRSLDSIYFGGGTPTLLDVAQLKRIFVTIRQIFSVQEGAEITVECAPGTLSGEMLHALVDCGVNRGSLGAQSFVDKEAASVGRLHKRETVLADTTHLREAGIMNINVDLIAGLPHQTRESWEQSLDQLIATEVPHASVYMLEVDDDSRLGRELVAGGQKYHAHFVPDEDLTADLYELACERLNASGIVQYEISNFARPGCESKHNLKYWSRQPYLGVGVDAHSMLVSKKPGHAVRSANTDSLERYLACEPPQITVVEPATAIEESFFLGLRLNRGVDVEALRESFPGRLRGQEQAIEDLVGQGLLEQASGRIRLTSRGRLLSNEVFQKFIAVSV